MVVCVVGNKFSRLIWLAFLVLSTVESGYCAQETSLKSKELDKASETVTLFFEQFRNKQFEIDLRARKGGGIFQSGGPKVYAFVYGPRKSRFLSEFLVGAEDKGKLKLEELFQESGQWLSAQQRVFRAGGEIRSSAPAITGMHDWSIGKFPNSLRLFWMGQIWNGSSFINIGDRHTITSSFRGLDNSGGLSVFRSNDGSARLYFTEALDRITSIEFDVKERNERPKTRYEICLNYDEKGVFSHCVWVASDEKDDFEIAYFVEELKALETKDGLLEFETIKIENGEDVKIEIGDPNKYQYFDGMIERVIDKSAYNIINELLRNSKQGIAHVDSKTDSSLLGVRLSDYLQEFGTNFHCGAYAYCAVAASLGVSVPLPEVIADKEMAGDRGASIAAIERHAALSGLYTTTFESCDFGLLDAIGDPAMLHFGSQLQLDNTSHWVVYLGKRGDRYLILDLPYAGCGSRGRSSANRVGRHGNCVF